MHAAVWIVALVAVVTLASALSPRLPVPAPLSLTVVGLVASFVPRVPEVRLSPEIVLIGFLPPLLYATAIRTSLIDFRRNRLAILQLSVGLVLATTFATALVVWWLLPVPFSVAVAVGAVVAPPDAVAATAVARRVGMPRRMVTVLEGEGLVNDATALVTLRTAIAATSSAFTFWRVGLDFVGTAAGGLAVGLAVAFVVGKIKLAIREEITDTAVSLITPFLAYLLAEELHCSGVLAVVVSGLVLSHRAYLLQTASARIFERTNWITIEFLLENVVFFFIGLQVRQIIQDSSNSGLPPGRVVLVCAAVTLTVLLVRPVWVFPMTYAPRLVQRIRRRVPAEPAVPWAVPAGISWAGMRGVVTLAAAFVLPDTPYRAVLILIALVVVGATLLLQGATLSMVLRRLGLHGPDAAEDALQLAIVSEKVTAAGLKRLEAVVDDSVNAEVLDRLHRRARERRDAAWERLGGTDETPSQAYSRLRTEMIDAERGELIRIRDHGLVPNEVLREALGAIDIEETVLYLGETLDVGERDQDLVPRFTAPACEHLAAAVGSTVAPLTPEGCAECLRDGLEWVHLRLCLTCGHVGCCDSSIGKHATGHYHETSHPVIRSFEVGEAWRWCFVNEIVG